MARKHYRIALLPGDGVGPEITEQGRKALAATAERFNFGIEFEEGYFGLAGVQKYGRSFSAETQALCESADAVLSGATGGATGSTAYKTIDINGGKRGLHKALGLTVNFRPARLFPSLRNCSALKPALVEAGVDMVVVRDISSGLWMGKPRGFTQSARGRSVINTLKYRESEVARILRASFRLAGERRNRLDVVAQDNSLESSQLWRQVAIEMASEYPGVKVEHHYPDAFGRLLLLKPGDFDVVVVDHMYLAGVFNDQCGAIVGSLGLIPSADLRVTASGKARGAFGFYEPAHGSVPHRAGKNEVNPLATVLAAALLLRHSLREVKAALAVEAAVETALQKVRTYDIAEPGLATVGTAQMGDAVARAIAEAR
jgi:3-isopropylmalate dehydrogenase